MDQSERVNGGGSPTLLRRKQVGDDRQRAILRAAIGVDEGARRRAQPRAPHRIAHQTRNRGLELAGVVHLYGSAVAEERLGNLLEVLHVRAEDDRFAVERWFEDVV